MNLNVSRRSLYIDMTRFKMLDKMASIIQQKDIHIAHHFQQLLLSRRGIKGHVKIPPSGMKSLYLHIFEIYIAQKRKKQKLFIRCCVVVRIKMRFENMHFDGLDRTRIMEVRR